MEKIKLNKIEKAHIPSNIILHKRLHVDFPLNIVTIEK